MRKCDDTLLQMWEKNWCFVSTVGFVAVDVFISLPTDRIHCTREDKGIYRNWKRSITARPLYRNIHYSERFFMSIAL